MEPTPHALMVEAVGIMVVRAYGKAVGTHRNLQ